MIGIIKSFFKKSKLEKQNLTLNTLEDLEFYLKSNNYTSEEVKTILLATLNYLKNNDKIISAQAEQVINDFCNKYSIVSEEKLFDFKNSNFYDKLKNYELNFIK